MHKFNVYDRSERVTSETTLDFVIGLITRMEAEPFKDGIQLTHTSATKREFKQSILKRDEHVCYICGCTVKPEEGTVDHVISKCNNGPFVDYNLRSCCADCNKDKNAMNLDIYIEYMVSNRTKYHWLTDERIDLLYDTWRKVSDLNECNQGMIQERIATFNAL